MEPNKISPDDPRVTAYALNEMAPAERAEFEQVLAQDEAAREAVAEISTLAATLTGALEAEAEPDGMAKATPAGDAGAPGSRPDRYGKVIRFPYWKISSLAAACFALFFLYWQHNLPEQKHYIEVPLTPPAAAKTDGGPGASRIALPVPAPAEHGQMEMVPAPAPSPTVDLPEATGVAAPAPQTVELDEAGRADDAARAKVGDGKMADERKRQEQAAAERTFDLKKEATANVPTTLAAQSRPAPASATVSAGKDGEVMASNSLEATATPAQGRLAVSTLAGTRVNTELRDFGGAAANQTWQYSGGQKANTEAYQYRKDSDYLRVQDQPLSTFSVDVDTASYANVRRFLTAGQRPPADAVRIEELVNYFPYHYQAPTGKVPFATTLEAASAPWAPTHRLVRIGLKGRETSMAGRPAANLVFLLDVSGSMNEPNKLPLVKQSLRLLVEKLRPDDHVAIVVYAGASGLALPSTSAVHQAEIMDAIDGLRAEGSTNGAMGIQLAYDIAKANFVPHGVNRVILATDGDFNVGVTNEGDLVRLVQEKAKSGVFLTVLGFGMGNLKDGTLEQLADKGNGNYAYIDTAAEARKTLVEQAGGTLVTIAKDVKIQVEFNPAVVQAYRLIGYENRLLAREDFNNDKVDAGEVGAGHTVTALYEVVPVGVAKADETPAVDALKYQRPDDRGRGAGANGEMLTVKIRYKEPADDASRKLEFTLHDAGTAFANASEDFKFAAAVAAFGMVLRDSPHKGAATLDDVAVWARAGIGDDAGGYRSEFLGLVDRARAILQ